MGPFENWGCLKICYLPNMQPPGHTPDTYLLTWSIYRVCARLQTNLIFDVHVVYCSEANRNEGHDAVLDPHAVGGEGDEQADLASHGGGKVALDELEDWEDDDGDDKEPREENPVELVEEAEVVAAVDDKATFSVEDHCGSEGTIFNHIVRSHCCTCT